MQQTNHPQTGTTAAGAGFQWRQFEVIVDESAGTALWRIDGASTSPRSTQMLEPLRLSGNISIGYMDPFTSVSDNAALSFGLIDNVRVISGP
ncbi:MAG: hypothetical protein R3E58_05610 [Phycisphaerae bacterium]